MPTDKLKESEDAQPKVKSSMSDFLATITKPNVIEEASKRTMEEKLERGETVVGMDEGGIYFMRRHEGKIEKRYEDKSSTSTQQSQDITRK